jgi:N-acetylneuraminate synthase
MENNKAEIKIGNRYIGEGHPVYVVAEIGLNHNGSLDIVKKIIDGRICRR